MSEVSGRWVNDEEDHLHGDLVDPLAVTGRADLTDAQWAVLEPLLPRSRKGRPPARIKRQLINGIRWRVRTGAPWRYVPPAYGPGRPCTACSAAGSWTGPGHRSWPPCRAGRTLPG